MKKSPENLIIVNIHKAQSENREENIKLLEKQLSSAVLSGEFTKFHISDKVNIECKLCFGDEKS